MFCLSKHQLMEIWIMSTFGPLWIMQLWTLVYKFFCGHMFTSPKSGITRSYVNSMCSILRTCQSVFQSSCVILHSHEGCLSILISSHPHQHLLFFSLFFFTAMLLSVMVLICIFLMANDVSMFSCVYCLYAFLSAWSTLQPKKKFETTLQMKSCCGGWWHIESVHIGLGKSWEKNSLNIFSDMYLGQNCPEEEARTIFNQW